MMNKTFLSMENNLIKTLQKSLWGLCLLWSSSTPGVECPSPAETITRAKLSRIEYVRVISEVTAATPNMARKEELFPFITLLDELELIGKGHQIESFGSSPLIALSISLTRNGLKWIRFDSDSASFVRTYMRWAENQTRYSAAQQQSDFMKRGGSKETFLSWNEGISHALVTIYEIKSEPFVIQQYEELQAQAVQIILGRQSEFSSAEMTQVIKSVKGSTALVEILTSIQQTVVRTLDLKLVKQNLEWLYLLAETLATVPRNQSFHVRMLPGQVFMEALAKLLNHDETLNTESLPNFISYLVPTQLVEVGNMIVQLYQEQSIADRQLPFLRELMGLLATKYEEYGLSSRAEPIIKFSERITMLAASRAKGMEGIYKVDVGGQAGLLTITEIGLGNFIMGLTINVSGFSIDYSFFHVTYDFEKDLFIGRHFAQDAPIYPHHSHEIWSMSFKLQTTTDATLVEGVFYSGKKTEPFSGPQIQSFENMATMTGPLGKNITGKYKGTLMDKAISLSLWQTGKRVSGRLDFEGNFHVNLIYGLVNPKNSTLMITSGEIGSNRWIQIRAKFSEDGKRLNAFYISGGRERALEFNTVKAD